MMMMMMMALRCGENGKEGGTAKQSFCETVGRYRAKCGKNLPSDLRGIDL